MILRAILPILTLALPLTVWAADGDACPDTYRIESGNPTARIWTSCALLCDAHVEADAPTCDMEIRPFVTTRFQWITATSCTADPLTVTLSQRIPGTTTFADFGVLSAVGDSLIATAPLLGDIRATINDDTACATTGIRVVVDGVDL